MDVKELSHVIAAILFVAGEPVDVDEIRRALDVTELLGTDELIAHQNEFVAFKGLTIEAYDENGAAFAYKNEADKTDDLYFKASYNGTTYAVVKLLALSDVSASWLLVTQRNVLNFLSRSVVKFVLAAAAVLIALVAVLHFGGRSRRYGKRSRRSAAASSGYRGRR